MYQPSTSASVLSCTNVAVQLRVQNQLCPGSSEHLKKKKPKHVLAQVSTCLCTGHHRFSVFKVESSVRLQPHHLAGRSQPDPKSPQRNSSFSVGSVVFWIWLVTPVSPRPLVLSFHLRSLFSLFWPCQPELPGTTRTGKLLKVLFLPQNLLWLIHRLQSKHMKHCL